MKGKWMARRGGRGQDRCLGARVRLGARPGWGVRIPGGREFPGILRDFFPFTMLEIALSLVKSRRQYGRTDGNR